MTARAPLRLVAANEPCRCCRGKGGGWDPSPHSYATYAPRIWVNCHACDGTGMQTLKIEPAT